MRFATFRAAKLFAQPICDKEASAFRTLLELLKAPILQSFNYDGVEILSAYRVVGV